jgi:hypothetical protein
MGSVRPIGDRCYVCSDLSSFLTVWERYQSQSCLDLYIILRQDVGVMAKVKALNNIGPMQFTVRATQIPIVVGF